MANQCSCGDRICGSCGGYNGNHTKDCPAEAINKSLKRHFYNTSLDFIQWCSWCNMTGGNHHEDCPHNPGKIKWDMTISPDDDKIKWIESIGGDMSCQCPYCQTNSLSEHETNCPFHPDNTNNSQCRAQFGWQCPKCGTIYAPSVTQCDCSVYEKYKVTCCES